MSCSIEIRIILWIYLLNITGVAVRGQIGGGPNAVVAIKGQTMLDCNTNDLLSSNWIRTSNGSSNAVTIARGCGPVTGNNSAHYSTEVLAGDVICRLIIANVTMQQAGVYSCYTGSLTTFQSLVTVYDPVASVVVNNRSEVVEGDQLNISCSISYNCAASPAPSLRPSPYWTTSPGQNFTSATNPSTNVVTLLSTVTVQRYTVPIFQCDTGFKINGTSSGYNSTAPAETFTVGSTTELDVQYPVGNTTITSTVLEAENCVHEPETLTCTANANPPAGYSWVNLSDKTRNDSAVLSISSGGDYQCTASNSIRNKIYNETKTVILANCYPTQNLTINGANCVDNICTCKGNDSESKQISITCKANGIPVPSVIWRSDNSFDDELDGTIVVAFDGNYTCIATNKYGGNEYNEERTVFVSDCMEPLPPTLPPSTVATTSEPATDSPNQQNYVGAIVGGIIGVFVIANIVATGLFFWYYKKFEVSHSGKKERKNKLKLDRKFTWLKKMMPCVSDTKDSAGRNCLWVSLFLLLGIVTGIVTFPIWILLANKYEKNNESSALNRRQNGDGNGNGENGRGQTNSSANHNQPPPTNQMNAIRREDPYQNDSSRENIELNNSLRSRNLLLSDSPPSRPPPAGRPPPPPNKPTMNLSTNRSKDYAVNDQQTQAANPEHTTYADLPFVPRNTMPTATPVQFLNVSNDTYASLNKT